MDGGMYIQMFDKVHAWELHSHTTKNKQLPITTGSMS